MHMSLLYILKEPNILSVSLYRAKGFHTSENGPSIPGNMIGYSISKLLGRTLKFGKL